MKSGGKNRSSVHSTNLVGTAGHASSGHGLRPGSPTGGVPCSGPPRQGRGARHGRRRRRGHHSRSCRCLVGLAPARLGCSRCWRTNPRLSPRESGPSPCPRRAVRQEADRQPAQRCSRRMTGQRRPGRVDHRWHRPRCRRTHRDWQSRRRTVGRVRRRHAPAGATLSPEGASTSPRLRHRGSTRTLPSAPPPLMICTARAYRPTEGASVPKGVHIF